MNMRYRVFDVLIGLVLAVALFAAAGFDAAVNAP